MNDHNAYMDLAERVSEQFSEIENDIIVNLRESSEEYAVLYSRIAAIKKDCPFISKVVECDGEISLTADDHRILTEYFRQKLKLDDMERKQLYFYGHRDCMAYLKRIGAL